MPIYEYTCEECGTSFGQLRGVRERDVPIECQACGREVRQRILSTFVTTTRSSAWRPRTPQERLTGRASKLAAGTGRPWQLGV